MNTLRRLVLQVLLLVLISSTALAQDVARMSNAALMRALATGVYTGDDAHILTSRFAQDFTWRRAGDAVVDLARWREEVDALANALPDMDADVLYLLTDGAWAAQLVRLKGTFDAPLHWASEARPPTGDAVEWLQFDIVRFESGLAVDGYTERPSAALLAQFPTTDGSRSPLAPVVAASASAALPAQQAAPVTPRSAGFSREQELQFRDTLDTWVEALQSSDAAMYTALLSDNLTVYTPHGELDRDEFLAFARTLLVAAPDLTVTTPALLVDGDSGAARLQIDGTFLGQWGDGEEAIFGSGQLLRLTANVLAQFDPDGKISALWWLFDPAEWESQFAAAPVEAYTP